MEKRKKKEKREKLAALAEKAKEKGRGAHRVEKSSPKIFLLCFKLIKLF